MTTPSGILLTFVLVYTQAAFTDVEEAVRAVEAGEALDRRVSRSLGATAAQRVEPFTAGEELERLGQVAMAGKAWTPLARRLAVVVEQGDVATAVRLLASYPEEQREEGAAALTPAGLERVRELAERGDDEDVKAASVLLCLRGAPTVIVQLLGDWAAIGDASTIARAGHLLELVATSATPSPELYDALARFNAPARLHEGLGAALAGLVARDHACENLALERATAADIGPGGVVLRSLGRVRSARWQEARAILAPMAMAADGDLEALPPQVLASVITAGGELLLDEIAALVPWLAQEARSPLVRAAAAQAAGQVSPRDGFTIDFLIKLLDDPAHQVVLAAHASLVRKGGERLPAEPATWRDWRLRANLPELISLEDWAPVLERERELRAKMAEAEQERLESRRRRRR